MMHISDYSIGDQVELTKDVCERKKGERGTIYERQDGFGRAIRLKDGTSLLTGRIRLVSPASQHDINEGN